MKNLLSIGIEKLKEVPIDTLNFSIHKKDRNRRFYHRRSGSRRIGDYFVWTLVERILKNNLGKSFDLTFSYICKIIPKNEQFRFLEEFEPGYKSQVSPYYIDDYGNIQKNKISQRYDGSYKGPYFIHSEDYKTEQRHKITNHKLDDFKMIYENEEYSYKRYIKHVYPMKSFWHVESGTKKGKFLYYQYREGRIGYRAVKSDFETVIVQGWEKEFKSKEDPEYRRIMTERRKQRELLHRKRNHIRREKEMDLLRIEAHKRKEVLKAEKEKDRIKILAHGFDLVTSFRNEKQTNPDLIHLKQRKLKSAGYCGTFKYI